MMCTLILPFLFIFLLYLPLAPSPRLMCLTDGRARFQAEDCNGSSGGQRASRNPAISGPHPGVSRASTSPDFLLSVRFAPSAYFTLLSSPSPRFRAYPVSIVSFFFSFVLGISSVFVTAAGSLEGGSGTLGQSITQPSTDQRIAVRRRMSTNVSYIFITTHKRALSKGIVAPVCSGWVGEASCSSIFNCRG